MRGRVISLDRGYPLVRTKRGDERAQHAIELVKNSDKRAAVGDWVDLYEEPGQDNLLITAILPRKSILTRAELVQSKHEGAGKVKEQVLAANFDFVAVVQSLGKKRFDLDYLERQLVMAHQSGEEVVVVLTKTDLARHLDEDLAAVASAASGSTIICSSKTEPSLQLARCFEPERIGVLLGRSGVGKSTLVNLLLNEERQATASVREKDNAGRHTTVARCLVDLPTGGAVIDTPGMRALGVLGAEQGLARTFAEIEQYATHCQFRNCTHTHEPACAVIAAVEEGALPARRLESYRILAAEVFD